MSGATTLSVCFVGNDVVSAEEETAETASDSTGDVNVEDAVSAKIKGTDESNDLAVIAVAKADIPQDTLAQIKIAKLDTSDDLEVGEQVVAIGNALGYEGRSYRNQFCQVCKQFCRGNGICDSNLQGRADP